MRPFLPFGHAAFFRLRRFFRTCRFFQKRRFLSETLVSFRHGFFFLRRADDVRPPKKECFFVRQAIVLRTGADRHDFTTNCRARPSSARIFSVCRSIFFGVSRSLSAPRRTPESRNMQRERHGHKKDGRSDASPVFLRRAEIGGRLLSRNAPQGDCGQIKDIQTEEVQTTISY